MQSKKLALLNYSINVSTRILSFVLWSSTRNNILKYISFTKDCDDKTLLEWSDIKGAF